MRLPSQNPMGLHFGPVEGYPLNNGFHKGQDFNFTPDSNIYAPEGGRVTLAYDSPNSNDGNTVHLWAGDRHHAFCHMSSFSVSEGAQVTEGQKLGVMGDTGFAQGTHLHWALAVNKTLVDPLTLITPGKGAGEPNMQEELAKAMKPQRNQIILAYKLAFGPTKPPTEEQIQAQLGQPDLAHVLMSIEGDSSKAWESVASQEFVPATVYVKKNNG